MPRVVPINDGLLDPQHSRSERHGPFSRVLRVVGVSLFLVGVGMGTYAAVQWLQTGYSNPTMVIDAIGAQLPEGVRTWLARPRSWYGLHRVAVWMVRIPVFASVAFVGFLLLLTSTASGRK